MPRGRKPLPAPQFQDVTEEQIAETVDMIANRPPTPKDLLEVFEFGGKLHAAQAFVMMEKFCAAARVRIFDGIKESRAYKKIPLKMADGTARTAQNLEEFCRCFFGQNYRSLAEESATLESLGDSLYETVKQLGISRASVRLLVALPENERESVQQAITAADKSEVASLIHDLVDKLEKARAALREAREEKLAAERLAARHRTRADDAEAAAENLRAARQAEPDPDKGAVLRHAEIAAAQHDVYIAYNACVTGMAGLTAKLTRYYDLSPGPDDGPMDGRPLVESFVEKVAREANALTNLLGSLKVANAAAHGEKQEWEIWAEEQDAAAAAPPDHGDDD
jgi:hypothetical protein